MNDTDSVIKVQLAKITELGKQVSTITGAYEDLQGDNQRLKALLTETQSLYDQAQAQNADLERIQDTLDNKRQQLKAAL